MSKILILKVIDKISVKCFYITILSVLPLSFPHLPNSPCFLFWQNPVFVLHQICYQFQLSQHRYWQFLREVYEVNKKGNDGHMLGSLDSSRICKKRVSKTEWWWELNGNYTHLFDTKSKPRFYDIPMLGNFIQSVFSAAQEDYVVWTFASW